MILPASTTPSRCRQSGVVLRSASSVEPSTMASSGKCSCTGPQLGCGTTGGAWACNRAYTSAKSCPITAAGRTSSRLVMACGLTRSGVTHSIPARAKTFCTAASARQPPPHQAHDDRHHDGQRQEPLAPADKPLWLPGVASFELRGASNDGLRKSVSPSGVVPRLPPRA